MPSEQDIDVDLIDKQETPMAAFSGVLKFPCCGESWEIQGHLRSTVECGKCHTLYGLALLPYVDAGTLYCKGDTVNLTQSFQTTVGSSKMTINPGIYTVNQDSFKILMTPPEHTLIDVQVPGERGILRTLVATIPNNLLEKMSDGSRRSENSV